MDAWSDLLWFELTRSTSGGVIWRCGCHGRFELPVLLAEVARPDLRVLQQALAGISQHDATRLDHVAAGRERERKLGVLLDQQDRHPVRAEMLDRLGNLLDDDRRQTERWLVEQEQHRLRP